MTPEPEEITSARTQQEPAPETTFEADPVPEDTSKESLSETSDALSRKPEEETFDNTSEALEDETPEELEKELLFEDESDLEETAKELITSQGLSYTEKSSRLADARSSSGLFICFGIVGILLILAVWLGLLPIDLALYMKVLYTIVLGGLFLVFLAIGIYYKKRIRSLQREARREDHLTKEIISEITENYTLEDFDADADTSLTPEQLYFSRYERIADLIREKFEVTDEAYLDFLIEKIYDLYVPENADSE